MSRITYKDARAGLKGTVIVYVDGRRSGIIVKRPHGYVYRPKGSARHQGDPFPTLAECKASLAA